MQLVRSPLRITLGGGGSDLTAGGYCVSAAIDKYVYVAVSDSFDDTYLLKYSAVERVDRVEDVKHRILRDALLTAETLPGIEITSIADIPAGTGLGSSGAFAVAVLKALMPDLSRPRLAELACRIDTGQQDQWSAVYGGVNAYDFAAGTMLPIETEMEDFLALYWTGRRRDSDRHRTTTPPWNQAIDATKALVANDAAAFAECLNQQWAHKLTYAPSPFHRECDALINEAREAGAYGGKLVGAGGGGFLLVCGSYDQSDVELVLSEHGLRRVPFRFDHTGTTLL